MRRSETPAPTQQQRVAPKLTTAGPDRAAALRELQTTLGNRRLQRLVRGSAATQQIQRDGGAVAAPTEKDAEKRWEKAGPFGDDVYKLLAELLTPAEISKLLKEVPAAVGGAVAGAIDDKEMKQATGLESAEIKKAIEAGGAWANKAAEAWLKGEKGKKFVAGVKKHLGEHPDAYYRGLFMLVAAAITVAVTLYAVNKLDPPNLEKEIKLGKGVSITPGLDLGKPEEQWLQAAKFGLKWQVDPRWSMGWGTSLTGTKEGYALGGTYNLKLLDEELKKSQMTLGLGGNYSWATGGYGGSLSFGYAPVGLGYSFTSTPDKGTQHTFTMNAELAKEVLKIEAKGVMDTLGKQDKLEGKVSGSKAGYDYSLAATWGLSENQLTKLTASLGFPDKKKTLSWLASLAVELKDDAYTITGNAALRAAIGKFVLRIEGKLSGTDVEGLKSGGIGAGLQIPLPHDFSVSPLLGLSYGSFDRLGKDSASTWMFSGGVGLGHKDLGAMPSFMWNQPLGSGMPGFPSIGITGTFDETKLLELFK